MSCLTEPGFHHRGLWNTCVGHDLLPHFYVDVPASLEVCSAASLTVPDALKMKCLLFEELPAEEPRKVL